MNPLRKEFEEFFFWGGAVTKVHYGSESGKGRKATLRTFAYKLRDFAYRLRDFAHRFRDFAYILT